MVPKNPIIFFQAPNFADPLGGGSPSSEESLCSSVCKKLFEGQRPGDKADGLSTKHKESLETMGILC